MPDPVTPAATQQPPTPAAVDPKATPPAVTPPNPDPKQEPRPDPLAPRFAVLAKQTREIAAAKQELARERAALEAAQKSREAEIQARIQKAEAIEKERAAALSDPAGHLRALYGDQWYDVLTKLQLEGEKGVPPDLQVRAVREELQKTTEQLRREAEERFKKLEEERAAARKAQEEQLRAEQDRTIQEFKADCIDFVKANAEKYELITSTGAEQDVLRVIEAVFQKNGRVLSAAEAADLLEADLEEKAAKVYSGKKWQTRLAAEAAKKAEQARSDEPARTLTNGTASGAAIPPNGGKKDRMTLALEAMEAAERAAAARAAK